MAEQNNGMQVVLMEPTGKLQTIWLPEGKPQGRYTFQCEPLASFRIEAKNGCWHAACGETMRFVNCPSDKMYDVALADHMVLVIRRFRDEDMDGSEFFIYVEEMSPERKIFCNYEISDASQISIGRNTTNDISYNNQMVSGTHALLSRTQDGWVITDNDSLNGVYVNNQRVKSALLKLGDVVFIVGLRIIIGVNFISLNCLGREIRLNDYKMKPLRPKLAKLCGEMRDDGLFNRQPRRRLALKQETIVIEGPPMSMNGNKMPLVLRMGSSMVMGTKSLISGNATMMLSSVLFPLLSNRYTDKERKEYEERRTVTYLKYLNRKEEEINREREEEERILRINYPALSDVLKFSCNSERLWERQKTDDDFLLLRIGTGDLPLLAKIDYPKERFSVEEDPLEQKMYALAEMPVFINDVPIQTSLLTDYVSGVSGAEQMRLAFVRHMVLYLVLTHSYDEVKVVFLGDEEQIRQFEFLRFIPHTWNDQRTVRFLAASESEAYQIGEFLKSELEEDLTGTGPQKNFLKRRPYYVVFAADKRLFDTMEILKDVLNADQNVGVSIVAAFENIPKECTKVFQMNATGQNSVSYIKQPERENDCFILDPVDDEKIQSSTLALANTSLRFLAQTYSLPKTYTFLEMFGVGRVEHLNVLERWRQSNPIKSLATPVGVATDGSVFNLDLHQKFQGPHGLVAGMTGSGKSEFLITYILSLAINYSPDEVAFVLIDYKGGGLAGAFDAPEKGLHLPHLVGTITNLDGAAIQRSMKSIQSELLRRQRIFREAKSLSDEGSVDIYSYQRLYRAGKVAEPLPHLFLISDEFAELKAQEPEFMDSLISAARIGRSLGIHLILATQKPAGVVNDQIRSNTKFRVCLRVQDKADSNDMLKRPDAAELKDTGRFYLQVGYNELFAMGQSAWAGAAYEPQDEIVTRPDDSVMVIDNVGQKLCAARPKVDKRDSGMTQLVAVVKHLSEIAATNGIHSKQLWQPELPKVFDLEELRQGEPIEECDPMTVYLGLLDDPENQKQFPMRIDFRTCQNLLVVGDSGSGKTVLIQNILFSLAKQLTPQKFNFYILDYSSRLLKLFKPLPHCGAVLQEEDSGSLDEFFKLIYSIITQRKQLFSELEIDSFEAARSIKDIPLVLVVIDNFAGLTASKIGEAQSFKLQSYIKDCANYGVKFVIACSHLNEAPSRIRQELGSRICLHMKDKYDYSEILGCKVSYIPPEIPGRGLVNNDGVPLEFQSASILAGTTDKIRTQYIKDVISELCLNFGSKAEAQRLPVFSETATYEDFARQFKRGRIPLGYSKRTGKPIALPLKQFSALSLYFGNILGVRPILENIVYAANREGMDLWIVKREKNSAFECNEQGEPGICGSKNVKLFSLGAQSIDKLRCMLTTEIAERNKLLQEYCASNGMVGEAEELYRKVFGFLRESTAPIMLLVECFADFCVSVDSISALVFDKCFCVAQRRNIYVIGCFEPEDHKRITSRSLYYGFNPEANIILFGGQFEKQDICILPDVGNLKKVLPFNSGLMNYQGLFYPILMPCGELHSEEVDEDEQSIF